MFILIYFLLFNQEHLFRSRELNKYTTSYFLFSIVIHMYGPMHSCQHCLHPFHQVLPHRNFKGQFFRCIILIDCFSNE